MLKISTDFECGSIGTWAQDGPWRVKFTAPRHGAPWAMWFYFRVEPDSPGEYEFVLTNLAECLEPTHWSDARPVMRPAGGSWQRARDEDESMDLAAGEFRFRFNLPGGPLEIAFDYPYTPAMLTQLCAELANQASAQLAFPGLTAEGRPFPYLCLPSLGDGTPETIWLLGREHAGEVSGSYVLEGFLRAAAKSRLRERFEFHCLPMVDLDSVREGRYGKDAPPADHDLCWAAGSPRPENRLGMSLMEASAAGGKRLRLLLNFHSPSPENGSYLVPLNPTLLDAGQIEFAERLAFSVVHATSAEFPVYADAGAFAKTISWFMDDVECRPEAFVLDRFGAELLLVETAYFGSLDGTAFTPEAGLRSGAALVAALESYLSSQAGGRTPIYGDLPPVYFRTFGWRLWTPPQFARAKFTPLQAEVVGDDPNAFYYFGAPRLFLPEEIRKLRVSCGWGGSAALIWTFYDARGVRLFLPKVEVPLRPGSDQTLSFPGEMPAGVRKLRPNFLLKGSFRPFRVWIGDE